MCWLSRGCLICITCTSARQMTGPQSRASRCPRKVKVKAFITVFMFTQAGLERWRKYRSAWEQRQRYWPSSLAQAGPPINSCRMCEKALLSSCSSSVGSQAAQSTLKAASIYYHPLQGTMFVEGWGQTLITGLQSIHHSRWERCANESSPSAEWGVANGPELEPQWPRGPKRGYCQLWFSNVLMECPLWSKQGESWVSPTADFLVFCVGVQIQWPAIKL